jgi:alpha-pyrone synthase
MSSYITAISTANPKHKMSQPQIASFMSKAMQMNESQTRDLSVLYRASGIRTRYSVIGDYGDIDGEKPFYPNSENLEPFPTVGDRMALFQREALPLALKAFEPLVKAKQTDGITHLVTVSCTGMYAPGLDLELIEELKLSRNIQRTAINFMGCYAAFNALKLADQFCKNDPEAKVAIICIELCSIHFQKKNDPDTILSNALFGDGAAAVIVSSKPGKLGLKLDHFFCDIAPQGKDEMAWSIGDFGFEMKLSTYVPDIIKSGIKDLTKKLLGSKEMNSGNVDFYAIHPGGKRILQVIEEELGLTKEDNAAAYQVLRNYGNMSSPTVLFVIKELMDTLTAADSGKTILSFAFGPGLTLESMLLKVESDV